MVDIEGLELPIRVEKTEDGIKVVFGMFSIRSDIVVDITNFLEAEEILDLENMIEGKEFFMTQTWFDVPSYINMTTSLFEMYGEALDEGQAVPDDEILLYLKKNADEMTEEQFIDRLYEIFGVI